MENIERRVRREVRAMTRREVITKVLARQLTWLQAAQVLGITPRHMRRVRRVIERYGMEAVLAQRRGRPRRRRIRAGTIELLIRLKRDLYADFSVRHFYEQVTEKHQVKVSYNWLRLMLQEAGVVEKELRAASTGAGASVGRWSACWCTSTPRPMNGLRVYRCRIW